MFKSIVAEIFKVIGFGPLVYNFLESLGIDTGAIGDYVVKLSTLTQVDEDNYDAGQAVVLAHLDPGDPDAPGNPSQPGYVVLIKAGGPAAQSLGL